MPHEVFVAEQAFFVSASLLFAQFELLGQWLDVGEVVISYHHHQYHFVIISKPLWVTIWLGNCSFDRAMVVNTKRRFVYGPRDFRISSIFHCFTSQQVGVSFLSIGRNLSLQTHFVSSCYV